MEPQHIKAKPYEIAEKAVICGDPERVVQLSRLLEHPTLGNKNRGFVTYTGGYGGEKLTVACHGVGGPSMAIVVEELVMLGAKAIVRLGSCGGLLKSMKVGDMVVATRAGYGGGTNDQYFGKKIRPVPDKELTELIAESARARGITYYTGPVFSSDAFYAESSDFVRRYSEKGYVAIEMECATLFGLGRLRKVKTASILLVSDNATKAITIVDAAALRKYAMKAGYAVFDSLNRLRI